ncbi:flagellar export chaperone FliS [Humisphaera borealis]|uniref:Flagellar export chaperone FliS n=1 Tax=Humisphaera borealis TaxID=2807512 RepID=A0A7M2WXP6_9BACT|nr:flagellar export chaperone FliS [Humisphaera borealis]QOV90265.1 flagellar export chaperone FliS [Humisphaera borealis]
MNPAQSYLRTRVLTATPEQLQMMLFDGALRFAEQGRIALLAKNWEQSYNNISRCQKIITEMISSLRHEVSPELCAKLAGLYNFAYRKLVEANIDHRVEDLDEAVSVLKYQRETWSMLLQQLGKDKAAKAAQGINMPAPDDRMEQSIRMSA